MVHYKVVEVPTGQRCHSGQILGTFETRVEAEAFVRNMPEVSGTDLIVDEVTETR